MLGGMMHEQPAPISHSAFSADSPALGYLYQFIFARNESVALLSEDNTFAIGIETLD